jgi:lysophospholipase L1-like esterase
MAYPAILGRRLGQPTINLGFSGSAIMEPEIAALLAELDPSVYVIDALANMNRDQIAQRTEPLVHELRKAHADTPIVLVEDSTQGSAPLISAVREMHAGRRTALKAAFGRLQAAGMKNLVYVEGAAILGSDGEGTVDGAHPTDLGMMRLADGLEPVLRPLLK